MRILFLLLVALFISPTFAQAEDLCYINDSDNKYVKWKPTIPKECEVGDILVISFSNRQATADRNTPRIASEFCDYEKQIKIDHQYLSCVLKTKTPRKKKRSRQPF